MTKQLFSSLIYICAISLLANCVSVTESSKKLELKSVCCNSISELDYGNKLELEEHSLVLDDKQPVFKFESGKSYFSAYALDNSKSFSSITVKSYPTGLLGIGPESTQIYCPQVTFLNSSYEILLSKHEIPQYYRGKNINGVSRGFLSNFVIPDGTAYIIFHTQPAWYGTLATRYSNGGAYMVGDSVVIDEGGDVIQHPCGPTGKASIHLK